MIYQRILSLTKHYKNSNLVFFKDSFWALLGSVVLRGSSLLTSIILARLLMKNDYGVYNSLKNTLTSLAVFTTFGLGYASTKFIADRFKNKERNDVVISKIYKITLTFGIVVSLFVFLFSEFLSQYYYNDKSFSFELKLLSFWILLSAITTSQNGIIAGLGKFKELSKVYLFIGIITIVVTVLFTYKFDLFGALISLIIIQIINVIVNKYFIAKKICNINTINITPISYRELLSYSLPLTLIEGINTISLFLNYYILQHKGGYGEVGIYSATMQWYILLVFIPSVLKNVILSHFSRQTDTLRMFKTVVSISFISSLIPCIIIFIFSPMIESIYGDNLKGVSFYIRLISTVPLISSIILVVEQYLFSISKNWIVFVICAIKDLGTSILFFIFTYNGADNIVLQLILSYLVMNSIALVIYLSIYFLKRRMFFSEINDNIG